MKKLTFAEAVSILEIPTDSHEVDGGLTLAYRKAMKKYHPDVSSLPKDMALEMAKLVNAAYELLHENMGKWCAKDGDKVNLTDILEEMYHKAKHLPYIKFHPRFMWLWVEIVIPPEFKPGKEDSLKTISEKLKKAKAFKKQIGDELEKLGFAHSKTQEKGKPDWNFHSPEYGASPWKRGSWGWDKINNWFGDDEMQSSPRPVLA